MGTALLESWGHWEKGTGLLQPGVRGTGLPEPRGQGDRIARAWGTWARGCWSPGVQRQMPPPPVGLGDRVGARGDTARLLPVLPGPAQPMGATTSPRRAVSPSPAGAAVTPAGPPAAGLTCRLPVPRCRACRPLSPAHHPPPKQPRGARSEPSGATSPLAPRHTNGKVTAWGQRGDSGGTGLPTCLLLGCWGSGTCPPNPGWVGVQAVGSRQSWGSLGLSLCIWGSPGSWGSVQSWGSLGAVAPEMGVPLGAGGLHGLSPQNWGSSRSWGPPGAINPELGVPQELGVSPEFGGPQGPSTWSWGPPGSWGSPRAVTPELGVPGGHQGHWSGCPQAGRRSPLRVAWRSAGTP